MYKVKKNSKTSLTINQSYEGETIETKVERIVNNKEPIKDGAPIVFTERKMGVEPQYNVRTDRFEIAVEAMDKIQKSHQAKREERIKSQETKVIQLNKDGETESTQGTNN